MIYLLTKFFQRTISLVHLLYGYFSMCIYMYIYISHLYLYIWNLKDIQMAVLRKNLNHIPALNLVGDWPFLMDQFHFSQRHIYPWNFNYYHEDSTNSVILLISSCPEGVYLPFIPSLIALLPPCHALYVGLP